MVPCRTGLCALLAADAFSPSALPAAGSLQLRSGARPSLCSLQARTAMLCCPVIAHAHACL